MVKDDIYRGKAMYYRYDANLTTKNFSKFQSDCDLMTKFVAAKMRGGYQRLVYDCNEPEKTCSKNIGSMRKITALLSVPFVEMTDKDIIFIQNKLNNDEVYYTHQNIKISYAYKQDMVKSFKQFWTFVKEYYSYEHNINLPDITQHFRIRKPKNKNPVVNFLTREEVDKLAMNAKNVRMRAFIKTFFETGARPIEIFNLKRINCNYDTEQKKWLIILPNMKGISTAKMPIQLDYAHPEFNEWMSIKNFEPEDYIFDYDYDYIRCYFKEKSVLIGKKVTPKLFRKSCAMYLVKNNVPEQYIKAHMGWSASSKSISNYINQTAIRKPESLVKDMTNASKIKVEADYSNNDALLERIRHLEELLLRKL